MAYTDPVSLTELRTTFDASTSTITANKKLGQKDGWVSFELQTLTTTTNSLQSSIAWTQQDDQEVRAVMVRTTDTAAGATVTATLTVDTENARFLVDQTINASVAAINGTAQTVTAYSATTGPRVRLLRGVTYRLTVVTTGADVGITEAGVQLRGVRRGGAGGPAYVPMAFRATGNLDVDKINANLAAIAGDIEDSQDQRYTYGRCIFDLAGLTDTAAAALRQFPIRRPASGNAVEIVGVELVLTNATTAVVWTLSKSGDTTWPTISATAAGTNVEVYASTGIPMQVASHSSDTLLQLSASTSAGNTITYGYMVVHTRCDRWNQGSTLTRYTPTTFDASTSTAAATMQAQIDAIATAVAADTAASVDLRCECFTVRSLASGSSRTWRLPAGARRIIGTVAYIVGAVGPVATTTVVGTGLSGSSVVATATGATTLVAASDVASGTMNTDPTVLADDATVTTTISGGGTALFSMVLVWWS